MMPSACPLTPFQTPSYSPCPALYRERLGFGPGDFPQAERIGDSTISLPFYPLLSDEEVERVIAAVGETAAELDHA